MQMFLNDKNLSSGRKVQLFVTKVNKKSLIEKGQNRKNVQKGCLGSWDPY